MKKKKTMTMNEFSEIFETILKDEFNIKLLFCNFVHNDNFYGKLNMTYYNSGIINIHGICFSYKLLNKPEKFIKNIIRHELIHYTIMKEWENNTKGVYNLLFPHGYYFIKECIKRKVPCLYYILTLGLSQIQWWVLPKLSIKR